jgi:hypothetical protein
LLLLLLLCLQARAFGKARSRGQLDSYTKAVAKAISDAPDGAEVRGLGSDTCAPAS